MILKRTSSEGIEPADGANDGRFSTASPSLYFSNDLFSHKILLLLFFTKFTTLFAYPNAMESAA